MKFDVRSVIQFVAVAEELSFRRAAERLRVPQPWLSTRIRTLEEQLGFPLFVRSTRRVELTEAGRAFLGDAAALAAAARVAEETARMLQNQQVARLRIGVPPYHTVLRFKSEVIRKFIEHRPHASVELDVGWSPSLLERLMEGSVDAAFVLDPPASDFIEYLSIGQFRPVLLGHDDDALMRRKALKLENLRGYEVAVFTRGLNPVLYDKLYRPFEAAGAKLLQVPEFEDLLVDRRREQSYRYSATLDWIMDHAPGPSGIAIRRFDDHAPDIPLKLARQKARPSRFLEEFWQMACALREATADRLQRQAG